ncbi:MAG: response regulator [Chloroflexota bacterium]|nr:response regulator [Chloroflexota bacterium]
MHTVMVADDNQFMRKRISKVLAENGYKVIEAENGDQATSLYRSTKPDVTLLDVVMPDKDGLEALAEIRRLDSQAKVIMLTALDQQGVALKAVQLGAKDFLAKPVPPDRLVTTLQKVLG